VRDSTGVITAKLLAEKANPQADAVMGVAASSLALLDKQGMLIPYAPLNLDAIMAQYRDKKSPPAWFGMDVWGATVCFNTIEAQKKNIPKPESWQDLTKPAYKGQIVMPNPASSGTGYFDVVAWLTLFGDQNGKGGGWKYMDGLHANIAQYTHSGSKPCNMAASGEFVVGISFEYRANANKAKGAPIDLVFPKRAWVGTWRLLPSTRAPKSSMPPRSWLTGRPAKTPCCFMAKTLPSPLNRALLRRLPMCPRITSSVWSSLTSTMRPNSASAFWRSGLAATTARPSRKSSTRH
jgi:ABC-type Fe3+ transport system substrate-binding protein